ncbi:MAG: glycosyltransferase [Propionibacteriaceae bacterium]|nr:glycosyltransferase [Propionibacteriaceae bacterium]
MQGGNPRLSVIVPVYNARQYVGRCLDSIASQTLSDFEAICVDDGSVDGSHEVLARYAQDDSRITVLTQPNSGVGAARNNGMRHASGTYLYFCDADDHLSPLTFSRCVQAMETDSLDLVFFNGLSFIDGDHGHDTHVGETFLRLQRYYRRSHMYEGSFSGLELLALMQSNHEYRVSPVMQMTRRDYVASLGISFDEGVVYEDNAWTFAVTANARRAGCLPDCLYYRRVHSSSITTTSDPRSVIRGYSRALMRVAGLASSSQDAMSAAVGVLDQYRANLVRAWGQLAPHQRRGLLAAASPDVSFVYRFIVEPLVDTAER